METESLTKVPDSTQPDLSDSETPPDEEVVEEVGESDDETDDGDVRQFLGGARTRMTARRSGMKRPAHQPLDAMSRQIYGFLDNVVMYDPESVRAVPAHVAPLAASSERDVPRLPEDIEAEEVEEEGEVEDEDDFAADPFFAFPEIVKGVVEDPNEADNTTVHNPYFAHQYRGRKFMGVQFSDKKNEDDNEDDTPELLRRKVRIRGEMHLDFLREKLKSNAGLLCGLDSVSFVAMQGKARKKRRRRVLRDQEDQEEQGEIDSIPEGELDEEEGEGEYYSEEEGEESELREELLDDDEPIPIPEFLELYSSVGTRSLRDVLTYYDSLDLSRIRASPATFFLRHAGLLHVLHEENHAAPVIERTQQHLGSQFHMLRPPAIDARVRNTETVSFGGTLGLDSIYLDEEEWGLPGGPPAPPDGGKSQPFQFVIDPWGLVPVRPPNDNEIEEMRQRTEGTKVLLGSSTSTLPPVGESEEEVEEEEGEGEDDGTKNAVALAAAEAVEEVNEEAEVEVTEEEEETTPLPHIPALAPDWLVPSGYILEIPTLMLWTDEQKDLYALGRALVDIFAVGARADADEAVILFDDEDDDDDSEADEEEESESEGEEGEEEKKTKKKKKRKRYLHALPSKPSDMSWEDYVNDILSRHPYTSMIEDERDKEVEIDLSHHYEEEEEEEDDDEEEDQNHISEEERQKNRMREEVTNLLLKLLNGSISRTKELFNDSTLDDWTKGVFTDPNYRIEAMGQFNASFLGTQIRPGLNFVDDVCEAAPMLLEPDTHDQNARELSALLCMFRFPSRKNLRKLKTYVIRNAIPYCLLLSSPLFRTDIDSVDAKCLNLFSDRELRAEVAASDSVLKQLKKQFNLLRTAIDEVEEAAEARVRSNVELIEGRFIKKKEFEERRLEERRKYQNIQLLPDRSREQRCWEPMLYAFSVFSVVFEFLEYCEHLRNVSQTCWCFHNLILDECEIAVDLTLQQLLRAPVVDALRHFRIGSLSIGLPWGRGMNPMLMQHPNARDTLFPMVQSQMAMEGKRTAEEITALIRKHSRELKHLALHGEITMSSMPRETRTLRTLKERLRKAVMKCKLLESLWIPSLPERGIDSLEHLRSVSTGLSDKLSSLPTTVETLDLSNQRMYFGNPFGRVEAPDEQVKKDSKAFELITRFPNLKKLVVPGMQLNVQPAWAMPPGQPQPEYDLPIPTEELVHFICGMEEICLGHDIRGEMFNGKIDYTEQLVAGVCRTIRPVMKRARLIFTLENVPDFYTLLSNLQEHPGMEMLECQFMIETPKPPNYQLGGFGYGRDSDEDEDEPVKKLFQDIDLEVYNDIDPTQIRIGSLLLRCHVFEAFMIEKLACVFQAHIDHLTLVNVDVIDLDAVIPVLELCRMNPGRVKNLTLFLSAQKPLEREKLGEMLHTLSGLVGSLELECLALVFYRVNFAEPQNPPPLTDPEKANIHSFCTAVAQAENVKKVGLVGRMSALYYAEFLVVREGNEELLGDRLAVGDEWRRGPPGWGGWGMW